MKSTPFKLIMAAGLFLSPVLTLQASVDSILNLDVKCYFQQKSGTADGETIGQVGVVRIDSKHLIFLIEKHRGAEFPDGSQLKVTVDGKVFVTDAAGNKLANVSKYLQAKLDVQNRLLDGGRNNLTREETSNNFFPIYLTFSFPELKGTIQGTALENYKVTAPNEDGIQLKIGVTNATMNGKGSINGKLSYYDGSLNLEGRKAIIR